MTSLTPETFLPSRYWEALVAAKQFLVPECSNCGKAHWYPRLHCPHCGGDNIALKPSAGRGTVYSFTSHVPTAPRSYLAYVEIEGVILLTRIVTEGDIRIGDQVQAVVSGDTAMPFHFITTE